MTDANHEANAIEKAQGPLEINSVPLIPIDADVTAIAPDDELEIQEQSEHAEEFVNEGLLKWDEAREKWLGKSDSSASYTKAAVAIDVDEIIDLIFSQRWRSPDEDKSSFHQAVPLPQMVDILVDLWEAEGLDI